MDSGRAQVPAQERPSERSSVYVTRLAKMHGRDCLVAPYAALGPPPTGSAVRTSSTQYTTGRTTVCSVSGDRKSVV